MPSKATVETRVTMERPEAALDLTEARTSRQEQDVNVSGSRNIVPDELDQCAGRKLARILPCESEPAIVPS